MPFKTWGIAMVVFLTPLECHPSDIRQRSFSYAFDGAASRNDNQFVICSDCPDSKLTDIPVAVKLAVRVSRTVDMKPPPAVKNDEAGSSQVETPRFDSTAESVHFEFGSDRLTNDERLKLDALLIALPKDRTFDLTGYTCTVGRSDYNEALSLRRARHIGQIFSSNGLTVGSVTGKGKCCPVSSDKRLNRRVEIREQRKEQQ